jgi:tripartite-type tricarboxylate transporter receptor subunit TctC
MPEHANVTLNRRRFVEQAGGGLVALGLSSLGGRVLAQAPAYPTKPITLVIPFPPGSLFDAVLRSLTDAAAVDLGQPVVLLHKPGGGGVTGTAGVATLSESDGYTLGVMHNSVIRQPHMSKVPYDPLRDFSYVAGLAGLSTGIVVAAHAPWKTLAELLADAKKRPGEISWGNVGATSANRIFAERLARAAGVKFNYIPFKGGAEEFQALLGGHLDVYGDPGFGAMAATGKVRVLATMTEQRLPRHPGVPTLKELGYDLVVVSPIGIVAPKNLDPAISRRLQAAIRKAEQSSDYQRVLREYDLTDWPLDSAAFAGYAQAQYAREKQMLDEVGFKPE